MKPGETNPEGMNPGGMNPHDLTLREATPADAPAYFAHMVRHFRESGQGEDFHFHPVLDFETWKKEEHVSKLLEAWALPVGESGWQRAWLLEEAGEVLGDVMLRSSHMDATAHRCQLGIGLERSVRGQGWGRRLTEQAIAWARTQPTLAWIDLWVFAHNERAMALYTSLGFEPLGTVVDQFRVHDQSIDDTQMALRLGR